MPCFLRFSGGINMDCPYCGSEIRIVPEQVDTDGRGLPIYHRRAYCDACGYQVDLDKDSGNGLEEPKEEKTEKAKVKYQFHKNDDSNEHNQAITNDDKNNSFEKTGNRRPQTVKAVYQFHTSDKKATNQNQNKKSPRRKISVRSIIAVVLSFFVLPSVFGIALAIYDLVKGKNDGKQHALSYVAIAIGVITLFLAFSPDNNETPYTGTETVETQTATTEEKKTETQDTEETSTTEETQDTEKTPTTEGTEPVEKDASNTEEESSESEKVSEQSPDAPIVEVLGEEYYNYVKAVLTDEIGFSDVRFVARQGESNNFEFACDGMTLMVTAYADEGDEYLRIFQPNTDNVFYEDGQLLMSKADLDEDTEESDDNTIYAEDVATYQIIAEEIVRSCMKNPSKAKFPSALSDEWGYGKKGDLIAVQSYVDGTNSFGASMRNKFLVEFYIIDKDTFSYEVQYIRIGNDEQGEFIDIS